MLIAHPGAQWSTADVEAGLRYGLKANGVQVISYRLDQRLESSRKALHFEWRQKKKETPDLEPPNSATINYHACVWSLEMALRHQVDAVLIISGMFFSLDAILRLREAGIPVFVLFTESPYDHEHELRMAAMVDGCWTHERSVVGDFKAVNRNAGYLAHAWHPERHYLSARAISDLPSHDVVFVGSGFPERITWFNSIDWSGIDLGLYGTWKGLGLTRKLMACVRGSAVPNETSAALYRRAKIGLNLYRRSRGWGGTAGDIAHAESLSPRAYELAACGAFHISENRAEVAERFGDLVPTFSTSADASILIRHWLTADRDAVARQLPACVAEHSWKTRAMTVIGDLQGFLVNRKAA